MLRRFDLNYALFSLAIDAALVDLALWLAARWHLDAAWLRTSEAASGSPSVPPALYLAAPLLWTLSLALLSLYDPSAIFRIYDEFRCVFLGSALAGLASAGLLFLSYRETSRWLFLLATTLIIGLLVGWRLAARVIMRARRYPRAVRRRVLIIGSGPLGQHLGRLVQDFRWTGLALAGFVDDDPIISGARRPGDPIEIGRRPASPGGRMTVVGSPPTVTPNHLPSRPPAGPLLGRVEDARQIALTMRADEVVITLPLGDPRTAQVVESLLDIPLHVRVVPDSVALALALDRPRAEDFAGVPMLDLRGGPLSDGQRFQKRIFDLVVGGITAVLALPIMAAVAAVIKLDSPGPVIFAQQRIGENGRPFTMYKFRSMRVDAEELQAQVNSVSREGSISHKRPDDPRVTRVGWFIRRTSLDELPQLLNVLRGDMSLVGPRPELPWLVEQYQTWQRRRLVVPPGMTGWWQVNGRSDKPMHLHTDEDVYYVANYSFGLDLEILWRTLWVVILGKGAH